MVFEGPEFKELKGSGPLRYYPAFLDLQGPPCLVVGGGQVGERKVKTLLACGAKVHLVSPELTPFLEEEVRQGRVRLLASEFLPEHLEGMFLVIGATDDPEVNQRISVRSPVPESIMQHRG